MAFLEERISIAIRYDNSYVDDFAVEIVQTGGSDDTKASEYRRLVHPFPVRRYSVSYQLDRDVLYADVLGLYHRVFGKYAGFRAKNFDDFSTNNHRADPTAFDQTLARVGTGIYQLQKAYGNDKTGLAVGYPTRTLFKPVSGSALVSINAVQQSSGFTVDYTTGKITFSSDPGVGAVVKGGCFFDIPVRFDAPIAVNQNHKTSRSINVELVELLTP